MSAVIRKMFAVRVLWTSTTTLGIPTIVGLMLSQGLTSQDISVIMAIFALSITVFEIPTGYFADRFGRETSMRVGAVAFALGAIFFVMANSFGGFLLGEICFAAGVSFLSGSDQAYVYDFLAAQGEEATFCSLWSKCNAWSLVATALLSLSGGALAALHARLPFIAEVALFVILGVIVCGLPEAPPRRKPTQHIAGDLRRVASEAWNLPQLRTLGVLTALIMAIQWVTLFSYQPYLELHGFGVKAIGLAFASFGLIAALGAKLARTLDARCGLRGVVALAWIMTAVTPLLMATANGIGGASILYPQQFGRGLIVVLMDTTRNSLVTEELRATHASFQSMIQRGIQSVLVVAIGAVITQWGSSVGMFVLVAVVCVPTLLLLSYGRNQKVL